MNWPLTVVTFVGGVANAMREVEEDRLREWADGCGVWALRGWVLRLSVDLDLSEDDLGLSEVGLEFWLVDESLLGLSLEGSSLVYVVLANDRSLSSLASRASCLVVSVVFSMVAWTFLISLAVYLGEKEAVL